MCKTNSPNRWLPVMQDSYRLCVIYVAPGSTFRAGKDFKNQVSIYRHQASANRLPPPSKPKLQISE
jgi:hypothetical protein